MTTVYVYNHNLLAYWYTDTWDKRRVLLESTDDLLEYFPDGEYEILYLNN